MGLEMVEITLEVEEHFGVRLPETVPHKVVTVADLQRLIVARLVQQGRQHSSHLEAEVYDDLVKIIVDQTGIEPTDIRPESRWVGDIT